VGFGKAESEEGVSKRQEPGRSICSWEIDSAKHILCPRHVARLANAFFQALT
jgi:hypothetical protein